MARVETNRRKVVRRLERDAWELARAGKEHDVYTRDDRPGVVIAVPRHRTLSPGVARSIAKAAAWID